MAKSAPISCETAPKPRDTTAGEAAAAASADAGATPGIAANAPPSPVHPHRKRRTGSQGRRPGPRRMTFIQLDASLNLRESGRGSSSRKAGHPLAHAGLHDPVERAPLFDGRIGGQAAPYALRPHVTRLAASPLAGIQTSKIGKVRDNHGPNGAIGYDALSLTLAIR